jgi:hypothetical protein
LHKNSQRMLKKIDDNEADIRRIMGMLIKDKREEKY